MIKDYKNLTGFWLEINYNKGNDIFSLTNGFQDLCDDFHDIKKSLIFARLFK